MKRLLSKTTLFAILALLAGCGGGGGGVASQPSITGTWNFTRASAAGATTISCPGGLMQNGSEIFSCSPQDTASFTNTTFEIDQLASGSAIPTSRKTIGTYIWSGNSIATTATVTQYALINGVYTATGTSSVTATYALSRNGNTLNLTTPGGVTIIMTQ